MMRRASIVFLLWLTGCATVAPTDQFAGDTPHAKAYSHYLAGVMHERAGRYEEALAEKRAAADLLPTEEVVSLLTQLARAYTRIHDYENALAVLQRLAEHEPQNVAVLVAMGRLHQELGHDQAASETYDKAAALGEEGSPTAYLHLLAVAKESNDLVTAMDLCDKLLELYPDSFELHQQRARTLMLAGDEEGARDAVERLVQLKPGNMKFRRWLGVICLDLEDYTKASENFAVILKKDPGNPEALEYMAATAIRMGQRRRALAMLEKAVAAEGATVRIHIERAYLMLELKRFEEVANLRLHPEAPIVGTLFRILARKELGQPYETLLTSLDDIASDVDTEYDDVLIELLRLFGSERTGGYLVDALVSLRSAETPSRNIDIALSRTYMAMGRYEEAAHVLLETLNRFGPDKAVHYHLATIYEALKRYDEMAQHLKACLRIDPDDAEVMNFLGYMYAEQNIHLNEAERLLKRALELEPTSGFYLDSLGWVYYRKGNADEAIRYIRKAILAMDNDDAVLRDHLGDAYLLKGDVEKALVEWRKALRLDAELEGVQEKIDQHQDNAQEP